MKLVHLFLVVAAIGAMGLAVPREIHFGSPQRETVIIESEKPPSVQTFNWYGGETVLERASDGHFYAEASVSGNPVLFLVDTGASVIALTGDDAYNLGLDWQNEELRPVGQGASGTIYGVNTRIDEVALGSFRSQNVEAVIIPEGLPVSLLGQSFLSQVENVEISGDRMILSGPE